MEFVFGTFSCFNIELAKSESNFTLCCTQLSGAPYNFNKTKTPRELIFQNVCSRHVLFTVWWMVLSYPVIDILCYGKR